MDTEHVISDELMREINLALASGENWMAYNQGSYFLEKGEVCFFKDKDSACEFAENDASDYDLFKVIRFDSITDLFQQIPYGKEFERALTDPDANGLYNKDGNNFTDAMIDRLEKEQIINNKKNTIMNDKNLDYLKSNLKYQGFGEKLNTELESNMKQWLPEFQLKIQTEYNKEKIEAVLHFKRSDQSDMYFFNRYDATLQKTNEEKLSQTFYLNKGNGVTIKEAYNLLNGRAVNKDLTSIEGQKYNAWIQLDLKNKNEQGNYESKQFHKNYGFDLEQSLVKFPVKELGITEDKEALIKSLQKGNIQSVTFQLNDSEQKMFVEANPQFKTINIYDKDMKLMQHESLKKDQPVAQTIGQEKQQEPRQETKDQSADKKQEINQSKKNNKAIKAEKSDSLLPKKRTSHKKGLSV